MRTRGGLDRASGTGVTAQNGPGHRELARPEVERLATTATAVTFVRTAACVALALAAAATASQWLLLLSLVVFWAGDVLDGALARHFDQETRIGAVLDIMADRLCAACFYVGYAWLVPSMAVPVALYLIEFLVLDMFLSLAFVSWPLSSPNYFYVVDVRLWRWNWSRPGKAVNSALFALLMEVTRDPWVSGAVAGALLLLKMVSMGWLLRIGLPLPSRHLVSDSREQATGSDEPLPLLSREALVDRPRG